MNALPRLVRAGAAPALAALLGCLTVVPARAQRVVEVQVAPPFLRLRPGAQAMVMATAYDREGMPVDARLTWSSTNINVATVDSTGAVRALAPGLAVITAASDTAQGRRRLGRATILVMSENRWTEFGQDKHLVQPGDTIAPAECGDPDVAIRNPGRECWDAPPRHLGPVFLEPAAACTPPITPPVFMARVESDGHVSSVRALAVSTCATYQSSAEDLVKGLSFWPAHRNGRAVAAWTVVAVRSVMMRMYLPPPPQPPEKLPQPTRP